MKFEGTKRNRYTKQKVRDMRLNRKSIKPKRDGLSPIVLEGILGDLQAAGHLRINGFKSLSLENERIGPTSPVNKGKYTLEFDCYSEDGFGERAHLMGYLESASSADKKPYRIKGWFNMDGSIRIELVK